MQAVPGAPGASCAGVVARRSRPSPPYAPPGTLSARRFDPPELDDRQKEFLEEKIGRVACSEPWRRQLRDQVLDGEVKYKEADQAKELRRVGLYPPGCPRTGMIECGCCRHLCPPARRFRELEIRKLRNGQVKRVWTAWQPLCIDCYYAGLPLLVQVCLPSSPGFSTPFPDDEPAAMWDGSGYTRRRRYLGRRGQVHEEAEGGDGFVYDLVVVPPAAEPAAVAEKGAA